MSKKRKRISRRRLAGQRVLAHVPTHRLETGEYKPVTAARRYIAEGGLVPPALLNVRRNEHTTDRFFWGEKGLFSAQYAEENHFLFPSLRTIVDSIGEDKLFEGLELGADDWEEMEEYEYAFVCSGVLQNTLDKHQDRLHRLIRDGVAVFEWNCLTLIGLQLRSDRLHGLERHHGIV